MIMYLKHRLFGLIFNIFSNSKINEKQIAFVIDNKGSFNSNFKYIKDEFEKYDDFEFVYFNKDNLSVNSLKLLAKSKYIFLADNFLALAFMKFNPESKIIQLWHAPGAFKKFGASSNNNKDEIRMIEKSSENVDYLITTSSNVSKYYRDAFRIDESKIKPFGLPRADYYFKDHDLKSLRKEFDKKFPEAQNKKIVLYAPTFRNNKETNNVFNFFDLEKFNEELSDDYILALKLHPKINSFFKENISSNSSYIDLSNYENTQELLLLSDVMISDYSSIMIEFAILEKPIIFFAYDYDDYLNKDRGFYLDFNKDLPGKIVYDNNSLIDAIKNNDFNDKKMSKFLKTQFNEYNGKASKKIVEFLLNNEE